MSLFNSQWAATLVELPTLTFHHALLPLSIFFALHGIRISMAYRQAIELAAPTYVPFIQGLLYYSYTSLYDILRNTVPPAVLDSVLITVDGSLRALSIAKLGVDGSRMRFAADTHQGGAGGVSEPWFAMLLLGTIAGSGGGMLADLLRLKTHQWTLATPAFVHAATFDMKAAFLSTFFYAASTSQQLHYVLRGKNSGYAISGGLLEPQDAKAMTMLVMCTLMLGQRAEPTFYRLTGFSLSPYTWIDSLQTKLANTRDNEFRSSKANKNRRGDETAEEEEEEESVRRSSRGKKKASVSKRLASPDPVGSSAETPKRNSSRIRKSVRKDL
ncbi:hypothetical protein BGZ49_001635 [Haplosporangium sp. Z 27]|nr:hypothetical protein BGZ49_001635 [Haplosporangium sp. Z 27]